MTLLALMMTFALYAQNAIKGVIVDETGEPLIGATVMQKGTTSGGGNRSRRKLYHQRKEGKCAGDIVYRVSDPRGKGGRPESDEHQNATRQHHPRRGSGSGLRDR